MSIKIYNPQQEEVNNMKKSGFTLAEVLISLCIVGILAAIMMPMVNKYRPDENKVRFLQMYHTLGETIPAIANSQKAYPIVDGSLNYNDAPLDVRAKDYINTSANWKKNNDQISYAELSLLPSSVTVPILPQDSKKTKTRFIRTSFLF